MRKAVEVAWPIGHRSVRPVMNVHPGTETSPPSVSPPARPAPIFDPSTLVAIYANRGVVRVPAHASMIRIRVLLIRMRRISGMARVNAGKERVIRRTDMAIRTGRAVMRNSEVRVVEDGAEPGLGHPRGMTRGAAGRIRSRYVIRNIAAVGLRLRKICLMAAVTIGRWIAGRVIAAEVAVRASIHHWPDGSRDRGARRQHVRPLQSESRGAVVKLAVCPQNGVVAGGTQRSRETRADVIGHVSAKGGCAIPGRLMAAIAIGVGRGEIVVVICVTVRALIYLSCRSQLVRARQGPARRRVVEHYVGPQRGVVAVRAIGRCKGRARRGVRRVIGLLPGCQVA